jgi:hypothetical protein
MRTEHIKGAREIEIFSRFVPASKLPFDLNTIEKRQPPEPDILCTHLDDGAVAFELVEICDPNLAEFMSTVTEGGVFYMRTVDPSAQIVRKKLRREYETDYPVELLCYTNGRVITPADVILPTIRPYLASWRSTFRRAWLLSRGVVHHVWSAG